MPRGVPRTRAAAETFPETAVDSPAEMVAESSVEPWTVDAAVAPETVEPAPLTPSAGLSVEPAPLAPSASLTAEQLLIRNLQDQLARERGKKDGEPVLDQLARPGDEANIVIHFLEDGFTYGGQIWYRGQEIEFETGSKAYQETFDRNGRSWLDLRNDDFAQVERWNKVFFRSGAWPGRRLSESKVEFERVTTRAGEASYIPTPEELQAAEQRELRRQRAAPRLDEFHTAS